MRTFLIAVGLAGFVLFGALLIHTSTAEPANSEATIVTSTKPDKLEIRTIDVNLSRPGVNVITFRDEWGRECTAIADSKVDMLDLELDCEDVPR